MSSENQPPSLNPIEQRVLGSLIEKSKTTPDYYPMTLNALTAACNQKTSRHPVTDHSEEQVAQALASLKGQSLVSTAVGGGSRTVKYKHNFTTVYPLNDAALAIICLLLLRGPLTPGELNSNSARLHTFSSLDSVLETLQELRSSSSPFVRELNKRPGQKETRYCHLLGELPEMEEEIMPEKIQGGSASLEQRLSQVEQELADLKQHMSRISRELFGE
jgi:uncharacterized protein